MGRGTEEENNLNKQNQKRDLYKTLLDRGDFKISGVTWLTKCDSKTLSHFHIKMCQGLKISLQWKEHIFHCC